ncbi:hypothetical protein [Nocardia salmonicida]|uniref:hypothetical protein n=1 Tax=Nocardia salmonicida TaxID=53431 RepID=UPI00379E5D76
MPTGSAAISRWLISRGEVVLEVPTTATARELSRGGRRKDDRIDSAAAASVASVKGEARPVVSDEHCDALLILDERRNNLSANRTRTVKPAPCPIARMWLGMWLATASRNT